MRKITTTDINAITFLDIRAKELKMGYDHSLDSLEVLQTEANTLYNDLLENIEHGSLTEMMVSINDLKDACSTFDEYVENYFYSPYANKAPKSCNNDQ
tara:strand:+ start:75 stop:368 length:294 start_codon:yes stop_codon:yes gene_type:complete